MIGSLVPASETLASLSYNPMYIVAGQNSEILAELKLDRFLSIWHCRIEEGRFVGVNQNSDKARMMFIDSSSYLYAY